MSLPILFYIAIPCPRLLFQNRELKDKELVVRQRALVALCDVLHNPEHISESIRVGEYASHRPTYNIKTGFTGTFLMLNVNNHIKNYVYLDCTFCNDFMFFPALS